LGREGYCVTVVDDGPIAGGETGRTTAHLSNALDDRYYEIERLHGETGARLAAESHTAAIDAIEEIVGVERIDCRFERVDGFLFPAPGQSAELLDRELEAAHRAGLHAVARLERAPEGTLGTRPCLHFPGQAQFDPVRYLAGLAQAIVRDGGRLARVHVQRIENGPPAVLHGDGVQISAQNVVIATNSPINDTFVVHTKQAPYTTYAIAAPVPAGSVRRALCWDMHDPYHYVRLADLPGGDGLGTQRELLIVGGEDHKTGQSGSSDDRHARLEAWARQRFPRMEAVTQRWSGRVMETVDGLAYIGHNPLDDPHVYIATGDSGMGMTHGTIAGILLRDLITERENAWSELYDPRRKTVGALGRFLSENLNVAARYLDWIGGATESLSHIEPGSGAVIRDGLNRLAVYHDPAGAYRAFSAACPHLGCVVAWNASAQTWDCPCHGSRFDCNGKVIDGPANADLAPVPYQAGTHRSTSP
jgi:glycine/D-amino acid oxidase-like deaminating enzyme/nitrite reductase/ring-hydroxylating ferredoxin subunit